MLGSYTNVHFYSPFSMKTWVVLYQTQ